MAIPNRFSLHSLATTQANNKDDKPKDERVSFQSQHDLHELSERGSSEVTQSWPIHPVECMRGPFQESIIEAMDPDARVRQTLDAASRRLQLLELDDPQTAHYSSRWRRKPNAKFHPLWKLIAQISFGIHLLHQQIAKSEEEVIRILQTHVDEIDGFLEDVGADFDLAMRDIDERLRLLLLPLEHGRTFYRMLKDRDFRRSIIEGNDIIERICSRTKVAMDKSIEDVEQGLKATAELAKFLDRLGKDWSDRDEDMQSVYTAMRGNAEGWYCAFTDIKKKGEKLKKMIRRLERIVAEVERQAGIASRRAVRSKQPTTENTPDESTPIDKTPVVTSGEASNIASPVQSRRPSSYRDSMNKPLPPDPTRRSSKQRVSHSHKKSTSQSNIENSALGLGIAQEREPRSESALSNQSSIVQPVHSVKPSVESRHVLEDLPEVVISIEPEQEPDEIEPSQIPLPLSPIISPEIPQEPVELEAKPDSPVSAESLIQDALPKARNSELSVVPEASATSPAPEKHQSASVVEAYNQAKSPSRSNSQRTHGEISSLSTDSDEKSIKRVASQPPRISMHFGSGDFEKPPIETPPELPAELPESLMLKFEPKQPEKIRKPILRKPVASRNTSQSSQVALLKDEVVDASKQIEAAKDTPVTEPALDKDTVASASAERTGNKLDEGLRMDRKDLEVDGTAVTELQPSKAHEAAPHPDQAGEPQLVRLSEQPDTTADLTTKSETNTETMSPVSKPRTRHSISTVGTLAQESIAVNRPRSTGYDMSTFPQRTVSMNAFGPAVNGIGDSNLPEVIIEPESPELDSGSQTRSDSPSTPTTPPAIPERSPIRAASGRPGVRSPVSYKLIPDIKKPPPSEPELQSPRTATPQFSRPEPQKKSRKPSINMFRTGLFKKSSRFLGSSGHGAHVATA